MRSALLDFIGWKLGQILDTSLFLDQTTYKELQNQKDFLVLASLNQLEERRRNVPSSIARKFVKRSQPMCRSPTPNRMAESITNRVSTTSACMTDIGTASSSLTSNTHKSAGQISSALRTKGARATPWRSGSTGARTRETLWQLAEWMLRVVPT